MIQINLLPDIKRQYLKSQQVKHTVIVASVLFSVIVLTIAALLFGYVRIIQPQHRKNIQADIDNALQSQKNFPDAVKLVTVQNALKQIGPLQDSKAITSRTFSYVASVTPVGVSYNAIAYDSAVSLLTITGRAPTTEKVNELANNIKSATYTYTDNKQELSGKPFTSSRFSSPISKSEDDGSVTFTIEIGINTDLFAQNRRDIKINVDASSEKLLRSFGVKDEDRNNIFLEDEQATGGGDE